MSRLLILDGNAIIHRAYHAMPPLTAPDGTLVNAVYGFTSMLMKIVNDFKPTHLAVAFDRPAPTFRKELYTQYQAGRPKMDEELSEQVDMIHDLVTAFGIAIFEKDGFEADDMIGTLVRLVDKSSRILGPEESNSRQISIDEVIIVTGDRDLLQLVKDHQVLVYMPVKGLSEGKLYNEKDVMDRMAVSPSQIPDFKALAGDSSDNYPGVEGIGPKTASELLAKYGSIECLFEALRSGKTVGLKPNTLRKLEKAEETSVFFKNLATIKRDVPIDLDASSLKLETLDTPSSRRMLMEFGFNSLLKRLDKNFAMSKPNKDKKPKRAKVKVEKENQQTLF